LLTKFNDKKTLVLNELHAALDSFVLALELAEMIEYLAEALADKPPVKSHTSNFIARAAKTVE
jgi:hypothetical protein